MPVLIGAWTEDFHILFPCPLRVIQLVGCIEVFFAGDVEHRFLFYANIGWIRKIKLTPARLNDDHYSLHHTGLVVVVVPKE